MDRKWKHTIRIILQARGLILKTMEAEFSPSGHSLLARYGEQEGRYELV
jgi:hypothetical protein